MQGSAVMAQYLGMGVFLLPLFAIGIKHSSQSRSEWEKVLQWERKWSDLA